MLLSKQPKRSVTVILGQKPLDRYTRVNDKEAHRARSCRIRSELSLNLRSANSLRTWLTLA
jgi:hypothetical protein